MEPTWTISELAAVAAAVLGDAPVRVNGRVRDLPNERLIRWYTTIGLLDPPSGRRGRTALYGERHLLQLVAIKRRQAAGRTIAQIQAELLGATNTTLRAIAQLPDPPAPTATDRPDPPSASDPTATGPHHRQTTDDPDTTPGPPARRAARTAHRRTSLRPPQDSGTGHASRTPAEHGTDPHAPVQSDAAEDGAAKASRQEPKPARRRFWTRDVPAEDPPAPPPPAADLAPVCGVRLAPGVRLTIDAAGLTLEDVQAIGKAAEPLLAELRRRGLTSDAPPQDAPAPPCDHTGRHP